jgi:Holliday junction resolvase RusA-like endonuclease
VIPRHDIPDWVARHPEWVARHSDVDPPQPRALCALSEDRQWLVSLTPVGEWLIGAWTEGETTDHHCLWPAGWTSCGHRAPIPDTGQDAREVLAAWLGGRTNAQAEWASRGGVVNSISFTVEGEPVAKERPRTVTNAYGETRTITPAKTRDHEAAIAWTFKAKYPGWEPSTDAVSVHVAFRTGSKSKDVDNMLKTVLDALNGVVYVDDRQVVQIVAQLLREGDPMTHVEVMFGGA